MPGKLSLLLPPVFYGGAALAMTWPLVAHLSTHIPGTGGDGPNFLWRLWWVPHAVFERGQSPWYTDLLFYPQGASLVFDTLVPLYGMASYPVQVLAGVVVTYNLLLMGSLVLAAWGSYLLARHLTGDGRAALIAGVIFGFSPYLLVHLWGHLNLVAIWPLPFFVLAAVRALEAYDRSPGTAVGPVSQARRWFVSPWMRSSTARLFHGTQRREPGAGMVRREPAAGGLRRTGAGSTADRHGLMWAVAAGGALAAASFLDYQYSAFALLWLLIAGGWCVTRGWGARIFAPNVLVVAVWLVLFSPQLVPALQGIIIRGEDPSVGNEAVARYFSGDLLGFVVAGHPRWGTESALRFEADDFQGIGGVEGVTYLGWVPLFLAIIGLRRGVAQPFFGPGFWALLTGVFALLALGPGLRVAGQDTGVPLPYVLLQHVPYLGTTRVPARFVAVVYLGVSMLAAFGLRTLLARFDPRWAAVPVCLAVIAVLADYGVAPLPLRSAAVPEFYRSLAADPAPFGVLPLPILLEAGPNAGSLGVGDQRPQHYQVIHRKPIVYGHVARGSEAMLRFYTTLPGIAWLLNPTAGLPRAADLDAANVLSTMAEMDIRYAVLHKDLYEDETLKMMRDYFGGVLGTTAVWDDAELLAFRLDQGTPGGPEAIDGFMRHLRPGVALVSPGDGTVVDGPLPLLRWAPEGGLGDLFEVQVSRDQWFGRSFLYHESLDGRLTSPPFSYRIPEAYPLAGRATYFWRVRRVENGAPGPWTPARRFRTP